MPFYIGIMTGNSMDAIDVVFAETDGVTFLKEHGFHSYAFSDKMQKDTAALRIQLTTCQTRADIERLPLFEKVHQAYIDQIVACLIDFIKHFKITPAKIAAVCFHGKTLDHYPPSRKDKTNRKTPYTVQMGSGQMLADYLYRHLKREISEKTVPIRVIYDFRSDDMLNGGEGAPLAPVLNAFQARMSDVQNRVDINAGNTSNLSLIQNGEAVSGFDLGPCNEYVDYLMRTYTAFPFDENGLFAKQGNLDVPLLHTLFCQGQSFYETMPPRSGDPAIYNTQSIPAFCSSENLADKVHTAVYFAAYLMVYGLRFIQGAIPHRFLLFGGGWKNPVLKETFERLLFGKGVVLKEHAAVFQEIRNRLTGKPLIQLDEQAQATESLLMALMGAYFDLKKPWTTPQLTGCRFPSVCGIEAVSDETRLVYTDKLCRACF